MKFVPSLFFIHISHQYLWCYQMPLVTQKYQQFLKKTRLSNCPLYMFVPQPLSASFKYSNPFFSSLPSIYFHMALSDELCLSRSGLLQFLFIHLLIHSFNPQIFVDEFNWITHIVLGARVKPMNKMPFLSSWRWHSKEGKEKG